MLAFGSGGETISPSLPCTFKQHDMYLPTHVKLHSLQLQSLTEQLWQSCWKAWSNLLLISTTTPYCIQCPDAQHVYLLSGCAVTPGSLQPPSSPGSQIAVVSPSPCGIPLDKLITCIVTCQLSQAHVDIWLCQQICTSNHHRYDSTKQLWQESVICMLIKLYACSCNSAGRQSQHVVMTVQLYVSFESHMVSHAPVMTSPCTVLLACYLQLARTMLTCKWNTSWQP